jgi:hypothetical protein
VSVCPGLPDNRPAYIGAFVTAWVSLLLNSAAHIFRINPYLDLTHE